MEPARCAKHHDKLLQRRQQLDQLIANVEQTLAHTEGRITMSNDEKFAGFKQKLIDDNEQKYGQEIREKYGEDAVEVEPQAEEHDRGAVCCHPAA